MASEGAQAQGRRRGNSLQQALQYAQSTPADHNLGTQAFPVAPNAPHKTMEAKEKKETRASVAGQIAEANASASLWQDLKSFKWMQHPESSLKMIITFVACWGAWQLFLDRFYANPLTPFLFISYPLQQLPSDEQQLYGKGYLDICFLLFYVVVFSFIRQSVTEWLLRPLAGKVGIRGESKTARFMEQGYAFLYFSFFSLVCFGVMRKLPTYWYQTDFFWKDYPHWRMLPELKLYYLLEFSYWLQQMLVLVLRLEKPRSDYYELIVHHIVTLWLVGWSYGINLTRIGVCIFFTMDVSDVFLALAKCINYTGLQRLSEVAFVVFLAVWSYFRHWLNLKMLWSVYFEWELYMPMAERFFIPSKGLWMAWWMKWQIFVPILLLQIVNLFWYFLIWRIVFRILTNSNAKDIREEEEEKEEEEAIAAADREQAKKGQ